MTKYNREAWNGKRGLSNLQAKEEYIKCVEQFKPGFKTQQKNTPASAKKDDEDDLFMSDQEYMEKKAVECVCIKY